MSDASPQVGTPLHGPGGLLGTPGMGAPKRRKARRWGLRLKDAGYSARAGETIRGNLKRGNDGKFTSAGGASSATPKRGNVYSKQPKPHTRVPTRTTAPKKGKGGGKKAGPKPKDPAVLARQQQRDQEHAADRAQRAADRQARLQRQAQRDQEHAADRAQRAADRAAKLAKTKQPKPAKGGGGKGSKPSADDKRRQRSQQALDTAGEVGLQPRDLEDLRQAAAGLGGVNNSGMRQLGLIGADGLTTDQGRRALSALERGDVRGYQAALQDAKARQGRETAAQQRKQDTANRRTQAETRQRQALDRLRQRARGGSKLTQTQRDQLTDAGLATERDGMWRVKETYGGTPRSKLRENVFAGPDRSFPIVSAQDVRNAVSALGRTKHDKAAVKRGIIRRAKAIGAVSALPEDWRTKSFVVFKDYQGAPRWIARTTTAYRDRDGEIIESAALDVDSTRMTATKQFGPLRYWHVGQPDPFALDAPWGPGLDIGDCDYSMQIGPIRLESGTFRDPRVAAVIAAKSAQYELSPGFFYPPGQPDGDGVYSTIRTFERSIVPTRYARASNLFTGLAVKESRMDVMSVEEMGKRFKTAIDDLHLDRDLATALGQQLVATVKSATEHRIAFKSAEQPYTGSVAAAMGEPQAVYVAADGTHGMIIDGRFSPLALATKAAAPPAAVVDVEDDPALGGDGGIDEALEADAPDAGGMDDGELVDAIANRTAEILMGQLTPLFGDMKMSEFKSLLSGVATKDAGTQAELAALKAQQQQLAQRIATIEGDQPALVLPDEVSAALKSAGPATADADGIEVPNDPARPFASIAARTMPNLYRTGPAGEFAGWTPPPPAS